MGFLKREGVGPLSPHFAEAYRDYYEYERYGGDNRKHPLEGMDKGTFRAELIAVGLGDTEELAKVLEVSERQAQNIKRDPSRLTKDRYKKLCEWLDNEDIRLQFLARDTDNMKEQGCATEDEVRDCWREYYRFSSHADVLRNNKPLSDLRVALRDEMGLRFLVESYLALGDADRKAVMRIMKGLLMQTQTPAARYMTAMVERERKPRALQDGLDWLAEIVSCDSEELDYFKGLDAREHAEEMGFGDMFSRAVLDEYACYGSD